MSNVRIQQQWYKKRLFRIRITFIVCALCALATSGIMIYFGLMPLNATYNEMVNNTKVLQTKLVKTQNKVDSLVDNVKSLSDTCKTAYNSMVKIAESCPALSDVLEEGEKENITPDENASVASLTVDSSSQRRKLQNENVSNLTDSPADELSENPNKGESSFLSSNTLEPTPSTPQSEPISTDNESVQISGNELSNSTSSPNDEPSENPNGNSEGPYTSTEEPSTPQSEETSTSLQNSGNDLFNSTSSPNDEPSENQNDNSADSYTSTKEPSTPQSERTPDDNESVQNSGNDLFNSTSSPNDEPSENPNGDSAGLYTSTNTKEPSIPSENSDNPNAEPTENPNEDSAGSYTTTNTKEPADERERQNPTETSVGTDAPTDKNEEEKDTPSSETDSVSISAVPTVSGTVLNSENINVDVTLPPTLKPTPRPITIEIRVRPTKKPTNFTFVATQQPSLDVRGNYTNDIALSPALPNGFTLSPALPNGFTLPPALPNGFTLPPALPNGFTLPPALPNGFTLPPNFTMPAKLPANFTIPPDFALPADLQEDLDEFVTLYTDTSKALETYSSDTRSYLETFDSYLGAIRTAAATTEDVHKSMESIDSMWFNCSLAFVGTVSFFTLVFMIRVMCAPKQRTEIMHEEEDNDQFNDDRGTPSTRDKMSRWIFFQSYVLIPLYFVFMFLLLIFTCGFAIAVVANADVCSGSPENNIMAIADKFELKKMDETTYKVLEYYIKGCMTNNIDNYYEEKGDENPFGYVDGAKATLQSATELVQSFQSYDNFNEEFSTALCGGNTWKSFQSLNDTATELGRILKGTNDKIALVMKSISCQVYTPIYVKYMHEDLCTNAANHIMALFFSAFALTIFVMIMLTLRVALLSEPIDEAAHLRGDEEAFSLIDGTNGTREHSDSSNIHHEYYHRDDMMSRDSSMPSQ